MLLFLWLLVISLETLKTEAKLSFENWNLPQNKHEVLIETAILQYFSGKSNNVHIGISLLDKNRWLPKIEQDLSAAVRHATQITHTIHFADPTAYQKIWKPCPKTANLIYVDSHVAFSHMLSVTKSLGPFVIILKTHHTLHKDVSSSVKRMLTTAFEANVMDIVIVVRNAQNRTRIYNFEIFNENQCRVVRPIATNAFVNGSFIYPVLFNDKFTNFHNCTLNIGTRNVSPYLSVARSKNSSYLTDYRGFEGDLVKLLAKTLNFQVNLRADAEETWGTVYKNGTTTGIFAALKPGNLDALIGCFGCIPDRIQYFSYSIPYFSTQIVTVVKNKNLNSQTWMIDPFHWTMWVLVLASLLLLKFATILRVTLFRKYPESGLGGYQVSWLDILGIGLNMSRNITRGPRVYMRFVCFFGFMIIYTLYQGKLLAAFNHEVNLTPRNFREAYNGNYSFLVGMLQGAAVKSLNIGHRTRGPEVYGAEALKVLKNSSPDLAVIVPREIALRYIRENQLYGSLKVLYPAVYSIRLCAFYQMDSFLVKPFDKKIRTLQGGGFFKFWLTTSQTFFKSHEQRRISLARCPKPLTLNAFDAIFKAYIALNLTAFIVLLGELIFYRLKQRRTMKYGNSKQK